MIVRSIEQWQALFKEHDESGLNATAFCEDNNLCPEYFSKRKSKQSHARGLPYTLV